ncbi:8153_t:CDS:2 [Paraglomus brasilianum]|uniref:8153_t:CDS:1 n=1 Tax=Paraglomus brasilianum TaxID=144538 RepID=A0A9N9AZE0_9GLOM|nr:8153_t:CDS:2 [Paraglomus brasilianum]
MPMTENPPVVEYQKDRIYTFEQFELLKDWLETNESKKAHPNTAKNHFHGACRWSDLNSSLQLECSDSAERRCYFLTGWFLFLYAWWKNNQDRCCLHPSRNQAFHLIEVEDVSADSKFETLTDKFKTEYFPAGVQLRLVGGSGEQKHLRIQEK